MQLRTTTFCCCIIIVALSLILPTTWAINGDQYVEPQHIYSQDGVLEHTLVLNIHRFECALMDITVRSFNDSDTGPTFHLYPGDKFNLTIVNDWECDGTENDTDLGNGFHSPNHTSIHTHGLHISPSIMSDNVLTPVKCGGTHVYQYEIPENHYPGTFWYHAHYHGSSSLHVMSGLIGVLIIEPSPGQLDPFIEDMEELTFLVHAYQLWDEDGIDSGIFNWANSSGDTLPYGVDLKSDFDEDEKANFWLVNGVHRPELTIEANKWYYLRIVNAGAMFNIDLEFPGCEWRIIARDGVYVEQPYEELNTIILMGARADLAVNCPDPGQFSMYNNVAYRDYLYECLYVEDGCENYFTDYILSGDVVVFDVIDSNNTYESFPSETYEYPERPSYLEDLSSIPDEEVIKFVIEVTFVNMDDPFSINGVSFSGTDSDDCQLFLRKGQVYEFIFNSSGYWHTMHMHVNHMQIISDTKTGDGDHTSDYAMTHNGIHRNLEFRDSVLAMLNRDVKVRFRVHDFTGIIMLHCHFLPHEDNGMMTCLVALDEDDYDPTLF